MLVPHRYGLMAANQKRNNTVPCFIIAMHCCVISSDNMDDEQTGFASQLLCWRSLTWYVNLVEHRWRSL